MSNSEQFVHPSSDLDDFPMDYNSVPTAIPVYGIIPSIAAAPSATAEVIPTHEIALSTPASREWVDKIHIMTAESHARVKAEQEWQKDHAVLSLKKESSSVSSLERPKQKAPGYQIKEYQTKDYSGLEYQSNYEYKSVYD